MAITATLVKTLRERTGVGMMACKDALTKADGDLDEAIRYLREKGLSSASKKADRSTNEGRIVTLTSGNNGVIVELNCETDFVATNDDFVAFGDKIAALILENEALKSVDDLAGVQIDGKAFDQAVADLILKIGENIKVSKFERVTSDFPMGVYVHSNAKVGAIVTFSATLDADLAKGIGMQVVAARPKYIVSAEVPESEKAKEKEIIMTQLAEEGKPAELREKIATGKLNKFFKEICLMDQSYIKDDKQSVKQSLKGVSVSRFVCYALV
eukprot:COSAG01_NODE_61_length_29729_cov_196.711779_16_plen_270_part_00